MNAHHLPVDTAPAGLEPGFASLPAFLQPQAGGDLFADVSAAAESAIDLAGEAASGAGALAASWLPGDSSTRQ